MSNYPDKGKGLETLAARLIIVATANRHRVSQHHYTMAELQRCVSICRRRQLVKPSTLAAAGFKPCIRIG